MSERGEVKGRGPLHEQGEGKKQSSRLRARARGLIAAVALALGSANTGAAGPAYRVVGDAIPAPIAADAGDPARGHALIVARDAANCVLCHAVSDPAIPFSGDVGPSLDGIGRRLTVPQLRLRVVDDAQVKRDSVMPSYYKVPGLVQVAAPYVGKPILSAREIEDIVAWLATLQ
jgi:sulfur-oxidizing protein SoxX